MDEELRGYLAAVKGHLMVRLHNSEGRILNRLSSIERDFQNSKNFLIGDALVSGGRWLEPTSPRHQTGKRKTLTPERFHECLDALSWSGRGLAALPRTDERQVRLWASGEDAIPGAVSAWFARLAPYHEAHRRQNAETNLRNARPPHERSKPNH